jgi:hypothetical protein
LILSVAEINTILGALGELPAKISFDLIGKVRLQADQQMSKKED